MKGKSEKSKDRRILRTKSMLWESLVELLREREYNSISVSDLAERANVGRSTFYLHFHDLDHLLVHRMDQLARELKQSQTGLIGRARRSGLVRAWFTHVESHRGIYRSLKKSGAWETIRGGFEKILFELFQVESDVRASKKSNSLDARSLVLSGGLLSLTTWWLEKGNALNVTEICSAFDRNI